MPLFNYIAIDKEGKQKEGTLEVGSQNEAISRIKEMGYSLKEVAEVKYTPRKKRKLPKEKKAESEENNGGFIECPKCKEEHEKILKECPSCGFNRFNSARAAKGLPPLPEEKAEREPIDGCVAWFFLIIFIALVLFIIALLGGEL